MRRIELGYTTLRRNPLLNEFLISDRRNVNAFYDILFLATKRANWSKELILTFHSPNSVSLLGLPALFLFHCIPPYSAFAGVTKSKSISIR